MSSILEIDNVYDDKEIKMNNMPHFCYEHPQGCQMPHIDVAFENRQAKSFSSEKQRKRSGLNKL